MSGRTKVILAVAISLIGLAIGMGIHAGLVHADEETSVGAEVKVVPATPWSYAARLVDSDDVLLPRLALRETDGLGATFYRQGWLSVKLERDVDKADTVSFWAAAIGLGATNLKVSVSADGKKWKQIDNVKINTVSYRRYNITGSFGKIGYIKIERTGSILALGFLDAVCAKGGGN